jgi:FKBP-type peptidyl-prolyl cis-trans isomerase
MLVDSTASTKSVRFRRAPKGVLLAGCLACLFSQSNGAQDGSVNARDKASERALAAPTDVADPPADSLKTRSGVAMKVLMAGTGTAHPAGDDCVILTFTAWKRDGSLFSTSGVHGESTVQCLTSAIPGVSAALKEMVAGEERRIWVPAELAFAAHMAHHQAKVLPQDSTPKLDLTIDVDLIRILKAPLPPPDLGTPPRGSFRTPSGVVIQVLKQGTGARHPTMNSLVILNYSGWTADGNLFESTMMSGHPAEFLVGTVIPGWRETLPRMVTGDTIRVWIPARLAYGERAMGTMGPAGNLVYDIELLEIR